MSSYSSTGVEDLTSSVLCFIQANHSKLQGPFSPSPSAASSATCSSTATLPSTKQAAAKMGDTKKRPNKRQSSKQRVSKLAPPPSRGVTATLLGGLMDLVTASSAAGVESSQKLLLCNWRALDWIDFDRPFDIAGCDLASSLLHFVAHGVRQSNPETTALTDALRLEVSPACNPLIILLSTSSSVLLQCYSSLLAVLQL
jgi:hypothetical protein